MKRLLALALLVAALGGATARADEPNLVLVHSGRLLDGSDLPVDHAGLIFTFRIFAVSAPNDTEVPLWTGQYTVPVRQGIYSVALGSGISKMPVSVFSGEGDRFLEVTVSNAALLPRLRLGTVPTAANAWSLAGRPAAEYALKAEVDALIDQKATSQVTALEGKLALKAEAASVYTKIQDDAALALKADAATALLSTGSYADPAWLTSLSASKLTGPIPFAGDLSGSQGAAVVARLQGNPVAAGMPQNRQVLAWNGAAWAPSSPRAPVTLTDAASIAVNGALGTAFEVTLGGNRQMANPTNLQSGELYTFRVRQDSTGGRTLTWGSAYLFNNNSNAIPVVPNAQSVVLFTSDGTNLFALGSYNLATLANSTGGTITNVNGSRIHTFTSSGTFVAAASGTVEVLVVGGGGSGGNRNTTNANGGGGGGGVIYQASYQVSQGPITVTVGAGGASVGEQVNAVGNDGQASSFGSLVALGGGGGGSTGAGIHGRSGGSGGGGAYNNGTGGASLQVGGMGNRGGAGNLAYTGGGGGGAGSPGMDGNPGTGTAGDGGRGFASAISGTVQYYGGGGGGGGNSSEHAGDGYDGGGRGFGTTQYYNYNSYPVGVNPATRGSSTPNAIPNTGGGGGGGSYWSCNGGWCNGSGAGGSGIVIVRYQP